MDTFIRDAMKGANPAHVSKMAEQANQYRTSSRLTATIVLISIGVLMLSLVVGTTIMQIVAAGAVNADIVSNTILYIGMVIAFWVVSLSALDDVVAMYNAKAVTAAYFYMIRSMGLPTEVDLPLRLPSMESDVFMYYLPIAPAFPDGAYAILALALLLSMTIGVGTVPVTKWVYNQASAAIGDFAERRKAAKAAAAAEPATAPAPAASA